MSDVPTLTLTRTILRFVENGRVVNEIVIEPGKPFTLDKLGPSEKTAFITYLIQEGKYREVEDMLKLPHYLKLVVPAGGVNDATRPILMQVVMQALSPDYRKSMLIRYIESKKSEIVNQAVREGVPRAEAEQLLERFIEEVKGLETLEEVMQYEARNPVNYITSIARVKSTARY